MKPQLRPGDLIVAKPTPKNFYAYLYGISSADRKCLENEVFLVLRVDSLDSCFVLAFDGEFITSSKGYRRL